MFIVQCSKRQKKVQITLKSICIEIQNLKSAPFGTDFVLSGVEYYFNIIFSLSFFPDNKLLNSLISCEPETVLALPDSSVPDDEKITQTLSNLYEKQLVGIIEWAKQIPGTFVMSHLRN